MMFCPNCDSHIKRTGICPKCGEPVEYSKHSRLAALFLALVFGMFGLHNLYTEHYALAAVQCLLSIIFAYTLYVPVFVWIWAMIEAIYMIRGKRYDAEMKVLR